MIHFLYYFAFLMLIQLYSTEKYPFSLPIREYQSGEFEPSLDTKTMNVHYYGHHQKYVDELNSLIKDRKALQGISTEGLLTMNLNVEEDIRRAIMHNAGGHENHTFFWSCLTPKKRVPSQKLKKALEKEFGSFEEFKKLFTKQARSLIGSGWVWLCRDHKTKKLLIITTENQESPLSSGLIPLLGLDVWEHAYYLTYQNKRADYIDAWWTLVNWSFVETRI